MRQAVLSLFAHPDDETFGPGATLARLAAEGHPVHLVTATRGEAGTIGESLSLGRSRLAEVRERELVRACEALGIRAPRILGLPDSGLAALGEEDLLRPFVQAIREIRPAILVTFHANGISGHSDHRTVTARVLEAFRMAAAEGTWPELGAPHETARAWAYCVPASKAKRITYREIRSVADSDVDASMDVADYIPAKRAAVAAHHTQRPFIDKLEEHLGDLNAHWREEAFVLAAARVRLPAGMPRPVGDLFAGMNETG